MRPRLTCVRVRKAPPPPSLKHDMVVGVLWFRHVLLPQVLAHFSSLMVYLLIAAPKLILKPLIC